MKIEMNVVKSDFNGESWSFHAAAYMYANYIELCIFGEPRLYVSNNGGLIRLLRSAGVKKVLINK